MKKLVIFVIVLGALAAGGYYGYAKVKSYAADKMVNEVAGHMSKQRMASLEKDPQVKAVLQNSAHSSLPAVTKKQAIQMVEKKFTPSEIKDFVVMAKGGFTTKEKTQIKNKLESRLTPEQMKSLEAVATKQLQNK